MKKEWHFLFASSSQSYFLTISHADSLHFALFSFQWSLLYLLNRWSRGKAHSKHKGLWVTALDACWGTKRKYNASIHSKEKLHMTYHLLYLAPQQNVQDFKRVITNNPLTTACKLIHWQDYLCSRQYITNDSKVFFKSIKITTCFTP